MTSSPTTTVRVRRSDAERLTEYAKRNELSVVDVLHDAVEVLERREFLLGLRADRRNLSPNELASLLQEEAEWDSIS